MGRAPCCEKIGLNRGPWTREEDLRLTQYVKSHGEGSWRTLPKAAGLLRCGKSCRLRWINYLRPDLKRGNITEEEDRLIIKLHALLGNRWSLIAGRLPGRTDNEIKNYWNTHLKKKLRSMGIDPLTHQLLQKVPSAPSPFINFKAKPLQMDATHLDALLKRAASFHSSMNQTSLEVHGRTVYAPAPISPVSVISHVSSSTSEIEQTPSSTEPQLTDHNKQVNNNLQRQGSSTTRSDTGSSDSSSTDQASELLTVLSDIYPARSTDEVQLYPNIDSEVKMKTSSPESILSLLETDFMWEMESIHPFEGINTPSGVLNTAHTSSDLWGYADLSWQ